MPHQSLHAWSIAGIVAGVVGLLVFLVVHHFWIKPLWDFIPAALPLAALGGAAMGWSLFHLQGALPPLPWAALSIFLSALAALTPGIVLAFTHGALFDVATALLRPGTGASVGARFALELAIPAVVIGALIGWRFGHTPVAAFATALAALTLALGPGHNVPLLGNHPSAGKGLTILILVLAASAVTVVPVALAVGARGQ